MKGQRQRTIEEGADDGIDRLSELPDSIVDSILSLVPSTKEAMKTSVLSKTWCQRWSGYPASTLKFDLKDFGQDLSFAHSQHLYWGSEKQSRFYKFHHFVDHTMQRVLRDKIKLLKFKLVTSVLESESTVPLINKWIDIALGKQVSEMELHVGTANNVWYHLPQAIFSSNSLETLSLGFQGMSISVVGTHTSCLRKLSLSSVRIDEEDFRNLITSCPLIEDLRIFMCQIQKVKISGLNYLKEFEFCGSQKLVTVEAPSLRVFNFLGYLDTEKFEMNLGACCNLESLSVQYFITSHQFHSLLSNFPSLKYLELKDCYNLEEIKLSRPSLQKLSIAGCKRLMDIEIDCPNIRCLRYENRNWLIPNFAAATTVNLQQAEFSFSCSESVDDGWFLSLRKFMRNSQQLKSLFLCIFSKEPQRVVKCSPNMNGDERILIPPLELEELMLDVQSSSSACSSILERLFRILHPKIVVAIAGSESRRNFTRQLICETLFSGEGDDVSTYDSRATHCWKYQVKSIHIEGVSVNPRGKFTYRDSVFNLLPILDKQHKFSVELDWIKCSRECIPKINKKTTQCLD